MNQDQELSQAKSVTNKKKGGRPSKKPSELYDSKVTVYLKKDEKLKLEKLANKEGMALGVMIRSILLRKIIS